MDDNTVMFKNKEIKFRFFSKTDKLLTLVFSQCDYHKYIENDKDNFYNALGKKLKINISGKSHFKDFDKSPKNELLLFIELNN